MSTNPRKRRSTRPATLRFRPIMMTTMAAILGSLPIAIGVAPARNFAGRRRRRRRRARGVAGADPVHDPGHLSLHGAVQRMGGPLQSPASAPLGPSPRSCGEPSAAGHHPPESRGLEQIRPDQRGSRNGAQWHSGFRDESVVFYPSRARGLDTPMRPQQRIHETEKDFQQYPFTLKLTEHQFGTFTLHCLQDRVSINSIKISKDARAHPDHRSTGCLSQGG